MFMPDAMSPILDPVRYHLPALTRGPLCLLSQGRIREELPLRHIAFQHWDRSENYGCESVAHPRKGHAREARR